MQTSPSHSISILFHEYEGFPRRRRVLSSLSIDLIIFEVCPKRMRRLRGDGLPWDISGSAASFHPASSSSLLESLVSAFPLRRTHSTSMLRSSSVCPSQSGFLRLLTQPEPQSEKFQKCTQQNPRPSHLLHLIHPGFQPG